MSKDSSEKYLDNLLNSINGDDSEDVDVFESAFGNKSEDDFLRMFESELETEDYNHYISDFEMELEADRNHDRDTVDKESDQDDEEEMSLDDVLSHVEANKADEYGDASSEDEDDIPNDVEDPSIGSLEDLDSAIGEFSESISEDDNLEAIGEPELSIGEPDMSIGEPDMSIGEPDMSIGEPDLAMTEIGEPDLAGNADADLEDMLGNDFSGLGDLLSGEGDVENPEGDEFENYAAKEMAETSREGANASTERKEGKKGGFFSRLLTLFFGDDSDDEVSTNKELASISEENAQLLQELEGESGKKGKKAKKEKKPKKEKEPKPKKEKPKKEKAPKPKKEKKPKVKDNTPPLPKVPVLMIVIMVASMFVLVVLGTNLSSYQTSISNAKGLYLEKSYTEAYKQLEGIEIKESDKALYDKLVILSSVSSELEAYKSFYSFDKMTMAYDSLVCAAGRYNRHLEDAKTLGCSEDLEGLRAELETELSEKFGTTMDEAIEIYSTRDRDDYSIAIYKKLLQMGLEID